jgi:predicted PurR-regulated permease PerM
MGDRQQGGFPLRTFAVALALTLLVLLLLTLGYLARRVLTWILIAVFLALALNPAVSFFERRGLGRTWASLVVFALTLVSASGLGYLLIPPLVTQATDFIEAVPDLIEDIAHERGPLGFLERDYNIVERTRRSIDEGGAQGALGLTQPAIGFVQDVATTALAVAAIAFLTLFFLVDGRRWVDRLLDLVPEPSRHRWERVAGGISGAIGGWVAGALVVACIAGTAATVVLFALGVPFAIALGLVVAVLDPIPLIGATVAAAVVAAVAFTTNGVIAGVIVLVFLVVYQQVENNLILPVVYGRTVQLSGLAVLIAVLVGGELAGVVGAVAAIPIAGSIQVVTSELASWRRERLIETSAAALREEIVSRSAAPGAVDREG